MTASSDELRPKIMVIGVKGGKLSFKVEPREEVKTG